MNLAKFVGGEIVQCGSMTGYVTDMSWEAGPEIYSYCVSVPVKGKGFRVMRIPEEYLAPAEEDGVCAVLNATK